MFADVAPTGIWWLDLLVYIASVLTAVTVIWKKGIKPAWPQVRRAWAALVALDDIAHEFKPNGGHSLRDSVDRMEEEMRLIRASEAEKMDVVRANAEKLDALDIFARAELAKVAQRSVEREQQVAAVAGTVDQIAARGKHHRKDDPPQKEGTP